MLGDNQCVVAEAAPRSTTLNNHKARGPPSRVNATEHDKPAIHQIYQIMRASLAMEPLSLLGLDAPTLDEGDYDTMATPSPPNPGPRRLLPRTTETPIYRFNVLSTSN